MASRVLLVAQVIEVEQLPDLFQAEPEPLALDDQFQPGPVAFREQAFLPFANRKQKFLRFIEPQCPRCELEEVTHFADGHQFIGHQFTL